MALPSFILASGSNELEKWSCVRNNEASRLRTGDSVIPPSLCPEKGRKGNRVPPTGTRVPVSQRKEGETIFVTV